jgi:hypothetical protein
MSTVDKSSRAGAVVVLRSDIVILRSQRISFAGSVAGCKEGLGEPALAVCLRCREVASVDLRASNYYLELRAGILCPRRAAWLNQLLIVSYMPRVRMGTLDCTISLGLLHPRRRRQIGSARYGTSGGGLEPRAALRLQVGDSSGNLALQLAGQ